MSEAGGGEGEAVRDSPDEELEEGPERRPEKALVFISYRLEPDEQTAVALRKLLENSFEPPIGVFVSSAGGLRPDNLGLNPQLQQAVQAARAFVAVITPASKDREWVIFEAGAAWGRGQLYAPLLIDTKPEDLSTTIGHYVATRADSREQFELLARSVAAAVGVTLKPRFGARYAAFQRHLEQRFEARKADTRAESRDQSTVGRAIDLWFQGQTDESRKLFDEALAETTAPEERANIGMLRMSLEIDARADFLEALERLDAGTKATAAYASWRAMHEDRPDISLQLLRSVEQNSSALPQHTREALPDLCQQLWALGRAAEATELLMTAIRTKPPLRRVGPTQSLLAHSSDLLPLAKLALIAVSVSGTGDAAAPLMRQLTDLAITANWPAIALFAAKYDQKRTDNGAARNNLGRAYQGAHLYSLAYDAYREAASTGVSVAKTNIAAILAHNAVPAAGLSLLKEHQGDFDSSSPGYPFRIRADIEDLVEQERQRSQVMLKAGENLVWRVAELVERSLDAGLPASLPAAVVVNATGVPVDLTLLPPFDRLWAGSVKGTFAGLFLADQNGDCSGLQFDPADADEQGQPVRLRRLEPPQPSPEDAPRPEGIQPGANNPGGGAVN